MGKINILVNTFSYDGENYYVLSSETNGINVIKEASIYWNVNTSIDDLFDNICELTGASPFDAIDSKKRTHIKMMLSNDIIITFEDCSILLKDIIEKFEINNDLLFIVDAVCGFGEVLHSEASAKGLKFEIHAREHNKHNDPHVHVSHSHGENGSVSLITFEQIAGNLKPKQIKHAANIIKNNQEYLINYWNQKTDGITIDMSVVLGTSAKLYI